MRSMDEHKYWNNRQVFFYGKKKYQLKVDPLDWRVNQEQ
jgi:hypothetical protein